uniref:Uncharacterized protein n=1 Tax=Arundo donax TaxID=35708 RepID=A0A0A9BC12_ARUDO
MSGGQRAPERPRPWWTKRRRGPRPGKRPQSAPRATLRRRQNPKRVGLCHSNAAPSNGP